MLHSAWHAVAVGEPEMLTCDTLAQLVDKVRYLERLERGLERGPERGQRGG